MNDFLQENKRSILILLGLLLILAIVLYVLVIYPLKTDIVSKEKKINSQVTTKTSLEEKIKDIEDELNETNNEQSLLHKVVPKDRELDEYILQLQSLEKVTKSKINSIEFLYDSSINDLDEEADENETEDIVNIEKEVEEKMEVQQDSTLVRERPEGLEVITVRISAISPNYDAFIQLLEIIENQERITIISKLKYDAQGKDKKGAIPFEAELTTFYYPLE